MATRALRPYRNRSSLADPRHLLRYLKFQAEGADDEAIKRIAKTENVSVATVKQSVMQVEVYRKTNTGPEMELAMRDLVISSIPAAKDTLAGLLGAMELVEQKDSKTGKVKVVKVEDKTTRLEAMRVFTSLTASLQPKGPAVEVNVSQTNQTANLSTSETNEERFRRLRKKADAHNLLPPETAGVPTYIDDESGPEIDVDDEEGDDDGDEDNDE